MSKLTVSESESHKPGLLGKQVTRTRPQLTNKCHPKRTWWSLVPLTSNTFTHWDMIRSFMALKSEMIGLRFLPAPTQQSARLTT